MQHVKAEDLKAASGRLASRGKQAVFCRKILLVTLCSASNQETCYHWHYKRRTNWCTWLSKIGFVRKTTNLSPWTKDGFHTHGYASTFHVIMCFYSRKKQMLLRHLFWCHFSGVPRRCYLLMTDALRAKAFLRKWPTFGFHKSSQEEDKRLQVKLIAHSYVIQPPGFQTLYYRMLKPGSPPVLWVEPTDSGGNVGKGDP